MNILTPVFQHPARHTEEEQHETLEAATRVGTMATIGIVLGAIGTVLGAASLIAYRRKAK